MTGPAIPEHARPRTVNAIIAAAHEVFTRDAQNEPAPQVLIGVFGMVGRRLARPGPPPLAMNWRGSVNPLPGGVLP